MKVWLKFLIGAVLGVISALVLPVDNAAVASAISFITELVMRFGRYIVVPLVFFTAVTAFNRLRESALLLKTGVWAGAVIVLSSLLLTLTGLLSILAVRLPRIPITVEKAAETVSLHAGDLLRAVFPYSAFESLNNGTFLLAAYFFALLLGTASTADPALFRPVTQLANSLSKLIYNIMIIFTEFLSIGMIAVLCRWTIQVRGEITGGVFTPLFLMLAADFVLVAAVIYPLILHYLCREQRPYKVLYASVCPILAAFFTGDANIALPLNIRHGKESLGIRRRISGSVYPLFSVFARGGSALVTTIGFIVIWRSYSSLSIPASDVVRVALVSFGISFLLGAFPAGGAFVSLTVLCGMYGRGFETGFLLLKPAAPVICSFAAAFDAVTAMFGTYIVAMKTKMVEHHHIRHFI